MDRPGPGGGPDSGNGVTIRWLRSVMMRDIIHINITEFPVAVEQVLEPRLRQRPVAVAVETNLRSLVLSLSAEARQAGVWRGMSLYQARKICRELIVLPPNPDLYLRATQAFMAILNQFSPIVEPRRYGHAYLDMTGCSRLFGPLKDAGARAQREIRNQLRLPAAVGLASNKLVSKIATDISQPFGLQAVAHGDEQNFIAPLPVAFLPGIEKRVKTHLQELNVLLIRQLALVATEHLTMVFGRFGIVLHQRALGIDPTPVLPPKRTPEIYEQENLADDSNDAEQLSAWVSELVLRAARRLRSQKMCAGKMILTIQYSDYKEASGQQQFTATDLDCTLAPLARQLFQRICTRRVRVRKLTLRLGKLLLARPQLSLFDAPVHPKMQRLTRAMDRIRDRFGENSIGFHHAVGNL